MNDKKNDNDDLSLFRQSVAGTRPLKPKNIVHHPAQPSAAIPKRRQTSATPLQDRLSDEFQLEPVDSNDALFFSRPGLQHGVIKKFRQGQFHTDAVLDLHGMTVTQARTALLEFINACITRNTRYAHIINGKGYGTDGKQPVLKNRVNHWLRQIDTVLAFSSAQRRDGGTGAIYVLLKRNSRR